MAFIRSETDIWIVLYYTALFFCALIMLCQIVGLCYNTSRIRALNHESWVSKQGATRNILISLFTTYSCSIIGIAVVVSRIGNHLYEPILCDYTYMISFMLFATAKLCNYYFFLQRAKLAQGLNKILPEQAFERVFPIVFMLIYAIYVILIILFPIGGDRVTSPNTGRILCIWTPPDIEHEIIFIVSTVFDVFMTVFLLYLYGKPLHDILKHTAKTSKTSEMKLQRCVMINFICTSVSSIHTAIVALSWYNVSFMSWWSIMDYAVNCLCLFLMFASNRRLLLHCCCCHYKCASRRNRRSNDNHNAQDSSTLDAEQHKSHALRVQMQMQRPSRSDMPSFQTVSDFPQPHGVLDDLESSRDKGIKGSPPRSPPMIPAMASTDHHGYKDAAERNGFVSTDGINYLQYLDSTNSCWYYKSKLFWTWFVYFFCFCGSNSLCKCYCCAWHHGTLCRKRMKGRKHVTMYLFGAAKKIQYMRYYQRLQRENQELGRQQSHTSQSARVSESQSSIAQLQNKIKTKPSAAAGGLRSLSGINEAAIAKDDSDERENGNDKQQANNYNIVQYDSTSAEFSNS